MWLRILKHAMNYLPKSVGEARTLGALLYFTGKPCKAGHVDVRYTGDRSCKACGLVKRARLYVKHAEQIKAKRRAAYAANPDKEKSVAKIRSAEWRRNNPDHPGTKAAKRAYKAKYPAKRQADVAKRRSAKLTRTPRWLTADDFWMLEEAYSLAQLRSYLFGFSWHVDHVYPLQGRVVSGLHTPYNVQVIPGVENIRKANRMPA